MRHCLERLALILAGALLLAACTDKDAEPAAGPPPQHVAQNEPVSAATWAHGTPFIFSRLDSSGDGRLEPEEIEAGLREGSIDGLSPIPAVELRGLLVYADRNADGAVDPVELSFFRTRVFILLDANRDGELEQSELEVAELVVGYAYGARLPR